MISVYNINVNGKAKSTEEDDFLSPLIADGELANYDPAQDTSNIGPDLIINRFGGLVSFYRFCVAYRRRWGFRPFILGITGESFKMRQVAANYTFSYQPDSPSNYYCPSYAIIVPYPVFHHNGVMTEIASSNLPFRVALKSNLVELQEEDIELIKKSFPKQRFCNFIATSTGAVLRRDFAKQLLAYKHVDCAGSVLNNTDELQRESPRNSWHDSKNYWVRGKLRYITQHRFTVAFENVSQPSYITEKILHPLMVGSIPIYWGAPNIGEFFNPACFINCHDYASFDAVIEHIKEIEADPDLYAQYLNAPKVLPDSRLYDCSDDKIQTKMNEVLQRVVDHQATRHKRHWTDIIRYRLQHFDLELETVKYNIIKKMIPTPILATLKRYRDGC